MAVPPNLPERELFDEAGYLRMYPDIGRAVAGGIEASLWLHYHKHGRREGRRSNDVDPAFYLSCYPQAVADIEAGRAADAASHYARFGRGRGYRPCEAAPRPTQQDRPWTDLSDAADLVDAGVELGRLSERHAIMLRGWMRDGFVVLDQTIDRRVVELAALDLERMFAGACPDLLFSCGAVTLGPSTWQPEFTPYPAAALDPHVFSHPLRALLLAEPIGEFLELLFRTRVLLTGSRGLLRDAGQTPQLDAASAAYTLPHHFATAWIGLEDVGEEAGAIHYFAGSHRLPPGPPDRSEQRRMAVHGLEPVPLATRRGRVVIRHPKLVHDTTAVPESRTRRGILAQYCPRQVAPLYAESSRTRIWRHGAHGFTTRYYAGLEPLD